MQAIDELDGLIAELGIIEISEAIARDAGDLADRFALRGYDAVHLAAALALTGGPRRRRRSEGPVVATWDRRLARGCLDAGLRFMPAWSLSL